MTLFPPDAFTQRSFTHADSTQNLLHREAFTLSSFYTGAYTHKLLLSARKFLRTEAFAQGSLYTEQLLNTNAFTLRDALQCFTQKLLQSEAFAPSSF